MLNYLGPNFGGAPVADSLPPATPGTMPSSVPGVSDTPYPLPAISPRSPAPPSALAAISNTPSAPAEAMPGPPPLPEYSTVTQEDGTILLHIKNPDGSLGPVVKVLPAIKRSEPQA